MIKTLVRARPAVESARARAPTSAPPPRQIADDATIHGAFPGQAEMSRGDYSHVRGAAPRCSPPPPRSE